MNELATALPDLSLIAPEPKRDAPQAVEWLKGYAGKETLLLMGNLESRITQPSLATEQERLEQFVALAEAGKQLTWMMNLRGRTVGAIWVCLESTKHLPSPALHIMIGDPNVRGQGIGKAAVTAVINYLKTQKKYPKLYSRYLTTNEGSIKLLEGLGFIRLGSAYIDEDGLEFQNVVFDLTV